MEYWNLILQWLKKLDGKKRQLKFWKVLKFNFVQKKFKFSRNERTKRAKSISTIEKNLFLGTITEHLTPYISYSTFTFSLAKLEQWNESRDNDIGYQIRSKELYYTAFMNRPSREK